MLLACYVMGAGLDDHRTWTTSFVFLGGDSTAASATDTSYHEMPSNFIGARFARFYYQADVTWGGMSNCSAFVDWQTGTGGLDGNWQTLRIDTITGDSLFSTSGYDLEYVPSVDSLRKYFRFRFRVQTDADDTGASAGEKVDSTYTISNTLDYFTRE